MSGDLTFFAWTTTTKNTISLTNKSKSLWWTFKSLSDKTSDMACDIIPCSVQSGPKIQWDDMASKLFLRWELQCIIYIFLLSNFFKFFCSGNKRIAVRWNNRRNWNYPLYEDHVYNVWFITLIRGKIYQIFFLKFPFRPFCVYFLLLMYASDTLIATL